MKNPIYFNFMKVTAVVLLFCFELVAQTEPSEQGTLTVTTVPAGMNVYVDGKLSGKSPIVKLPVPAGSRIVSIETEPCYKSVLFYSWNRSVYIEKGLDTAVEIVPEPILTSLKVGGIEVGG
ncbi:MAG TPA: PEGA domain-containing protein, partial [bacterium]|nr:PEGA domain-containing protein [bacterium]